MASKDTPPTLKEATGLVMSFVERLKPPLISIQPKQEDYG